MQCVKCCVGHAVLGNAVWVMQCVKCCVGCAVWGNAVWVMLFKRWFCIYYKMVFTERFVCLLTSLGVECGSVSKCWLCVGHMWGDGVLASLS